MPLWPLTSITTEPAAPYVAEGEREVTMDLLLISRLSAFIHPASSIYIWFTDILVFLCNGTAAVKKKHCCGGTEMSLPLPGASDTACDLSRHLTSANITVCN